MIRIECQHDDGIVDLGDLPAQTILDLCNNWNCATCMSPTDAQGALPAEAACMHIGVHDLAAKAA